MNDSRPTFLRYDRTTGRGLAWIDCVTCKTLSLFLVVRRTPVFRPVTVQAFCCGCQCLQTLDMAQLGEKSGSGA